MLYLAEPSNIDSSFLYDDYVLYSKSVSATAVKQDHIPFGVCACTL